MIIDKQFGMEKMTPVEEVKNEEKKYTKEDLKKKLEEIDSEIQMSKYEAHKTREIMKGSGLDKEENFKDNYDSTISEVAGKLNDLRNERNKIKAELEEIDSAS